MTRVSPVGGLAQAAEQVVRWMREADRVVIGAGSGLSATAGLDFGDEADFAARFPALVRRGLTAAHQMIGERLLLLDVGSGFNTPSVVRWPMERIALQDPDARLVRVNLHHADLPRELGGRGLSVAAGAREALAAIAVAVEAARPENDRR